MDYQKNPVILTADKLQTNYGSRVKREEKDQQALIFARALLSAGGTFEFTNEHKEIGYATIFEAMAADMHDPSAKLKIKVQNGEEFEHVYRNGCSMLNSKLMTEWDFFIIYAIPRRVDDKSIQVITMNRDLIVNPEGQTAAEVHELREKKRATGQLNASAKKLTRSIGQERTLAVLTNIVSDIESMTQLPHGTRTVELVE